jgi:hypothetical protein
MMYAISAGGVRIAPERQLNATSSWLPSTADRKMRRQQNPSLERTSVVVKAIECCSAANVLTMPEMVYAKRVGLIKAYPMRPQRISGNDQSAGRQGDSARTAYGSRGGKGGTDQMCRSSSGAAGSQSRTRLLTQHCQPPLQIRISSSPVAAPSTPAQTPAPRLALAHEPLGIAASIMDRLVIRLKLV